MRCKSYLSSVLLAFVMGATMLPGSAVLAQAQPQVANINGRPPSKKPHSVPEIEVAGLAAAGILLVGGLAVAAGRRRKSPKP